MDITTPDLPTTDLTDLPSAETTRRELPLSEAPASGCGCGGHDEVLPELDARAIPHAIRHGAILGALGQLTPGKGLVLVAPHDPKPLLRQITDIFGDSLTVTYDQRGADSPQADGADAAWKLRMVRR
ncbi:DUF2249 domain-containing protein [Aestuariimicrobium soli]|uniref:DUF2249 domain-containing protein n=1 Tax=Aestuariimicrobium soli TaxID=2035834 RepID=UPI003EC0CD26